MSRMTTTLVTGVGVLIGIGFLAVILTFAIYYTGPGKRADTDTEPVVLENTCTVPLGHNYTVNGSDIVIKRGLQVYMVTPADPCSVQGAVILVHNELGYYSKYNRFVAMTLAKREYTVAMPYFFQDGSFGLTQQDVHRKIDHTLDYLREERNFEKIAIIGYGWGGTQVARACALYRGHIKAGISLYASNVSPEMALAVVVPTFFIYASNDDGVPISDVIGIIELLRVANRFLPSTEAEEAALNGSPVSVQIFENTTHAFANTGDTMNDTSLLMTSEGTFSAMYSWLEYFMTSESN
ncbi:carboxymethylenebutenolidase homolog [Ptychodera flava]|uniref:carboxymethylenebutenolidase homolog n=1 Tax=Ptychodera flava TaxID=63121 RepID=UPI003969D360